MDATAVAPPPASAPAVADPDRLAELTLDALKRAVADPGEHRLFRAGKFPGLFPARTGTSADAAVAALSAGLLETVRTEQKGRQVVEWVRATPRAVGYVHDRDSPKAVLRELKEVIAATRAGVPAWMATATAEVAALRTAFERQAAAMMARLDALAGRVDAALTRAELAGLNTPNAVARAVPWAADAVGYLDRRAAAGGGGDCPLGELFRAVRDASPDVTVADFHDGLRRLHDVRAV